MVRVEHESPLARNPQEAPSYDSAGPSHIAVESAIGVGITGSAAGEMNQASEQPQNGSLDVAKSTDVNQLGGLSEPCQHLSKRVCGRSGAACGVPVSSVYNGNAGRAYWRRCGGRVADACPACGRCRFRSLGSLFGKEPLKTKSPVRSGEAVSAAAAGPWPRANYRRTRSRFERARARRSARQGRQDTACVKIRATGASGNDDTDRGGYLPGKASCAAISSPAMCARANESWMTGRGLSHPSAAGGSSRHAAVEANNLTPPALLAPRAESGSDPHANAPAKAHIRQPGGRVIQAIEGLEFSNYARHL